MAGHAQLKFVMTECWKTQIRSYVMSENGNCKDNIINREKKMGRSVLSITKFWFVTIDRLNCEKSRCNVGAL